MPYRQQKRNKPIASLIKWYMDKKSRKVSESRKEIYCCPLNMKIQFEAIVVQ